MPPTSRSRFFFAIFALLAAYAAAFPAPTASEGDWVSPGPVNDFDASVVTSPEPETPTPVAAVDVSALAHSFTTRISSAADVFALRGQVSRALSIPLASTAAAAAAAAFSDDASAIAAAASAAQEAGVASAETCASITDCDACYNTTGCHFCENDNKCHAIGSIYGCVYGLTCPSEDPCFRSTPQHRGYGSVPPGYAVLILLVLAGAFAVVVGALYCVLLGCGRGGSSSRYYDDGDGSLHGLGHDAAGAGAGAGAGGVMGGSGADPTAYYELQSPEESAVAAAARGRARTGSFSSNNRPRSSSSAAGAAAGDAGAGASAGAGTEGQARWLRTPPTQPPAPAQARADLGLPSRNAGGGNVAAAAAAAVAFDDLDMPPYMRAQMQQRLDRGSAGGRDGSSSSLGGINSNSFSNGGAGGAEGSDLSESACDCCYSACCCLWLCGHRGGGLRGAGRTLSRWAKGLCACKPREVFALLFWVVAVMFLLAAILALVYFPVYPGYSLCNKQIHWGSILSSLTEFNVAVNATFHFALHNPNRFDIRVNHLTCYIKYKNNPVAVASVAGGGSPAPKPPKRLDFAAFPEQGDEFDAALASVGGFQDLADTESGSGMSARVKDGLASALSTAAEAALLRLLPSPPSTAMHVPLEPHSAARRSSGLSDGHYTGSGLTAPPSSTFLPAGAVTDVRIEAKIDPESDVATAMALDYALGSLFLDVELFIDTSVALWERDLARVNASYAWDHMDVNGPPDRELCKCG